MKQLFALTMLLLCTACGHRVIYLDPPEIPKLPLEIREACPPLPLLEDGSIETISLGDVDAAYSYAACQTKHQAAVDSYEAVRQARAQYMAEKKK